MQLVSCMARQKPLEVQGVFQMKAARSLLQEFRAYAQRQDQTVSQLLRCYMRQCLVQQSAQGERRD
jgi:hypothetical protein